MTARLNENTQYTDPTTGELLVNGFIYIGANGVDAKLNPITIYADRDLSVPILNPQRTGSDGRAVSKIFIPGQYSIKVENSENVQKLNDLSAGSDAITGNSTLINVSGTNLIVAELESPASSLKNNQIYILTAANTNTAAMTLTIDSFPTYPIKKHHDVDMEAGDIEVDQTLAVIWNETDFVYELFTNSAVVPLDVLHTQTAEGVKTFSDGIVSDVTGDLTGDLAEDATAIGTFRITKGADIDSANDLVLLQDGNYNDITGVITVNGMTDGVANEKRRFHADGVFTLKHNTASSSGFSSLYIIQGAADITTAAGDEWSAIYDGTVWRVFDYNRAANNLPPSYEEGAWTPVLSDGTNSDATYAIQVGSYEKIGRQVTARFYIAISSLGTISGSLRVLGLPYAASSDTNALGPAYAGTAATMALTAGTSISGYTFSSSDYINLFAWDSVNGTSTLQSGEFTAAGSLNMTVVYYV